MWLDRRLETDGKDNRENGALQCDADLFRDRLTHPSRCRVDPTADIPCRQILRTARNAACEVS